MRDCGVYGTFSGALHYAYDITKTLTVTVHLRSLKITAVNIHKSNNYFNCLMEIHQKLVVLHIET